MKVKEFLANFIDVEETAEVIFRTYDYSTSESYDSFDFDFDINDDYEVREIRIIGKATCGETK